MVDRRGPRTGSVEAGEETLETLHSLAEACRRTQISKATLWRYCKLFPERIPWVGVGPLRRYPESALEAFRELKRESLLRRKGRGRVRALAEMRRALRPSPDRRPGGRRNLRSVARERAMARAALRRIEELELWQAQLQRRLEELARAFEVLASPRRGGRWALGR